MNTILELKKQIEKVILLLEQRLIDDPDRPILKTLYDRYVRAEEILNIKANINRVSINEIVENFTMRGYEIHTEAKKLEKLLLDGVVNK